MSTSERISPVQRESFVQSRIIRAENFHFTIGNWRTDPQAAQAIFGQFWEFTFVIGQTIWDEYKTQDFPTIPDFHSPDGLASAIKTAQKVMKTSQEDPTGRLVLTSSLAHPIFFIDALVILEKYGLLTNEGLRTLALEALDNVNGFVDPKLKLDIRKQTSNSTLTIRAPDLTGQEFLRIFADNMREFYLIFHHLKTIEPHKQRIELERDNHKEFLGYLLEIYRQPPQPKADPLRFKELSEFSEMMVEALKSLV